MYAYRYMLHMCMYIYIYIYTYIYAHEPHVNIHTHAPAQIHICMGTHVQTFKHAVISAYTYANLLSRTPYSLSSSQHTHKNRQTHSRASALFAVVAHI